MTQSQLLKFRLLTYPSDPLVINQNLSRQAFSFGLDLLARAIYRTEENILWVSAF